MKTFRDIVVLKQPLGPIWETVRDRLPELAMGLDDIDSITVIEREKLQTGKLRLVNEWRSNQRVPGVLKNVLGASSVSWIDRNEWDDSTRCCTWGIEPSILPEHVRCLGATRYQPAMGGRGTRVTFEGEFELASGTLQGLAGPFEQPVSAFVESLVTILIPRNLRKVMDAAAQLLAAGA